MAYGIDDCRVFYLKARNIGERRTPNEELLELIDYLPAELLLRLTRGKAGTAIVVL